MTHPIPGSVAWLRGCGCAPQTGSKGVMALHRPTSWPVQPTVAPREFEKQWDFTSLPSVS